MYIIYIIHIIYILYILYINILYYIQCIYIYGERERDDVPNIAGVQ